MVATVVSGVEEFAMKRIAFGKIVLVVLLTLPIMAQAHDNRGKAWEHRGHEHHHFFHGRHQDRLHKRFEDRYPHRHGDRLAVDYFDGVRVIIGRGVTEIGYRGHRWSLGSSYLEHRRDYHYGQEYKRWQKREQRERFNAGFGSHPKWKKQRRHD